MGQVFLHLESMNDQTIQLSGLDPAELDQITAESIGWLPIEPIAYLHVGNEEELTIEIVGIPDASMAGLNVLLLGY